MSTATPNGNGTAGSDPDVEHLGKDWEGENALQRIRTAGSISISPELFEKLYLQPRDATSKKGLSGYFANPTPIALVGFLLSLTPLSNDLMGWRGAGPYNGLASLGGYYFFGGLLMIIGAVGEFIIGNTFPAVVFASFGAFWLQFGATLQDGVYGIVSGYPNPADFYNEFAFTMIWMGVLCFIYLIVSLRTNVCFVIIFFTLVMTFGLLSGTFWQVKAGNMALAGDLQKAAGAFGFLTCVSGWWILAAILLASVDFPISLPVGDLSTTIKGKKDKTMRRDA